MRRQAGRHAGQGMVEFGVMSLLLFTVLFGIIEFGWLLYHNHQVNNAAREGARFAIVNGEMSGDPVTEDRVRERVLQRVAVANPAALIVELTELDGDLEPDSRVRVDVTYTHQPLTGLVSPGVNLTLQSDSTMRIHY